MQRQMIVVMAGVVLGLQGAEIAFAQSAVVTSSLATGPGSLANALQQANAWAGAGPFTINFPSPLTITLSGELPVFNNSRGVVINGNGSTIDGGSTSAASGSRIFFFDGGTNTINHLTLRNANARGGAGGPGSAASIGGGGGAGLGGAIYVNQGSLIVSNTAFINNRAVGGAGGGGGSPVNVNAHSGGGGGGLGGAGGAAGAQTVPDAIGGGGGGGVGLSATGGAGSASAFGASTGAAGILPGSSGGSVDQNGGLRQGGANGGGGGGGNQFATGPTRWAAGAGGGSGGQSITGLAKGGNGGFGGGGGGAGFLGFASFDGVAGDGGFGGGGGGAATGVSARGGNGGFGGGGGGGATSAGFGAGGNGGFGAGTGNFSGGGGGLGAGGAIFVRAGASLTLVDSTFTGNTVQGGLDGFGQTFGAGQGLAPGVFLGGNTTFTVSAGQTLTPEMISGANHSEASGILLKNGGGTLNLSAGGFVNGLNVQSGIVNLSGGTTFGTSGIRLEGGELVIASPSALGVPAAPVHFVSGSNPLLRVTGSGTLAGTITGPARLQVDAGNTVNVSSAPGSLEVLGAGLLVLNNSAPIDGNITVVQGARLRVESTGLATNSELVINGGTAEASVPNIFNFNPQSPSGPVDQGNLVVSEGGSFESNQTQAVRAIRLSGGTVAFPNPAQPLVMRFGQIEAATGVNEVNAAIALDAAGVMTFLPSAGALLRVNGPITGSHLLRTLGNGVTEVSGLVTSVTSVNSTWTLFRGVLAVSSDSSLGPVGSRLSFSESDSPLGNPTVRCDAPMTINRPVTINQGGASTRRGTFDTNGHDISITGTISGVGNLIKIGAGTLTLAGSNTLTGSTTVNAGTLVLTALPTSPLTVNAGGALSPAAGIGTLSLGQPLTLAGGSTLRIDFNTGGPLAADSIVSTSSLDLTAASAAAPVTVLLSGAGTLLPTDRVVLGDFAGGIVLPPGANIRQLFQVTGNAGHADRVLLEDTRLILTGCRADFDASGSPTVDDIFIFINAWFASDPRTDIDASGSRTIDDIFIFINLWFAGC